MQTPKWKIALRIAALSPIVIGPIFFAWAIKDRLDLQRERNAPTIAAGSKDVENKEATLIAAASDLDDQWKSTFDKTGHYPEKQDPHWHRLVYGQLLHIPDTSPNYPAARKLISNFAVRQIKINKIEQDNQKRRIANDADGRKQFASRIETNFLKDGRDMVVKAYGPKNTILELDNVSINRPFVYKATNETNILSDAWNAGFAKVIFRGYLRGAPWVYNVPKH